MNTPPRSSPLAHIAMLAVALFYALNFFILKKTFLEIPPLAILSVRGFMGALLFALLSRFIGREKIQSRKDYIRLFFCGLIGVALNQWLFLWGLSRTSEVNASVLMITTPVFVFLFAFLMRAERLSVLKIVGLLLSFAGAAMISLGGRSILVDGTTISGDLMIMGNAACYACYLVLVRPLLQKYHVFTIISWVFIFGAIFTVPAGFPAILAVKWATISSFAWFGLIYVVLFVTILAYAFNAWAMQSVPASYVGIYIYIQPVLVSLITWLFFKEVMEAARFGYIFAVFVGVFLVTYKKISRESIN